MTPARTSYPGRARLLIVDDYPLYLQMLVDLLGEAYDVSTARSGAEALGLLRTAPLPDLILLDIMMPGMDGYAVCREIKRQVSMQHIPVIFITALDEKTDEILGFEAGAADYIAKPFEPDVVLARVRNQLRHKFAFDALREKANLHATDIAPCEFRSLGHSWQIGFRGEPRFSLRDMLGLAYLQCLMAHPERYFSVEEVMFLASAKERENILERAARRLDASSLDYYRSLTEKVVEGCRQQHAGLAGIQSGTVEQLLGELRRVGILASDVSSAIDDRERYRKSVGNAIRRAIGEIAEHDIALASHLQFPNLRLGYELVYMPATPVFWRV